MQEYDVHVLPHTAELLEGKSVWLKAKFVTWFPFSVTIPSKIFSKKLIVQLPTPSPHQDTLLANSLRSSQVS